MTQSKAGAQIGVDAKTVRYWEKGRHEPPPRYYPKILKFVGYDFFREPENLPEALRQLRLRRGLTALEASRVLGGSKTLWCHWEVRGYTPRNPFLARLKERFGIDQKTATFMLKIQGGKKR